MLAIIAKSATDVTSFSVDFGIFSLIHKVRLFMLSTRDQQTLQPAKAFTSAQADSFEFFEPAVLEDFSAWLDDELGKLEDDYAHFWTQRSLTNALVTVVINPR